MSNQSTSQQAENAARSISVLVSESQSIKTSGSSKYWLAPSGDGFESSSKALRPTKATKHAAQVTQRPGSAPAQSSAAELRADHGRQAPKTHPKSRDVLLMLFICQLRSKRKSKANDTSLARQCAHSESASSRCSQSVKGCQKIRRGCDALLASCCIGTD